MLEESLEEKKIEKKEEEEEELECFSAYGYIHKHKFIVICL